MRFSGLAQGVDVGQLDHPSPDAQGALKLAAGGGDPRAADGQQFREIALAQAYRGRSAAFMHIQKQGGHPLAEV